jgi:nucleotide-binding universal stress UspA family protein
MKILLAADGSPHTGAATEYLRRHLHLFAPPVELHVLHVHAPLPSPGRVKAIMGPDTLHYWERAESEAALEMAQKALQDVGADVQYAWSVGGAAEGIEAYVLKHGIDLVVMGSHGYGAVAGLAMGSVARECIRRLAVPVLVVPQAAVANDPAKAPSAQAGASA